MIILQEKNGVMPARIQENLKFRLIGILNLKKVHILMQEHLKITFLGILADKNVFIVDLCTVHVREDIKLRLKEANAEVIYIPKQCTKFLQPLDPNMMNSFKKNQENIKLKHKLTKINFSIMKS